MKKYRIIRISKSSKILKKMKLSHQLQIEFLDHKPIKLFVEERQGQQKNRKIKSWNSLQDTKLLQLYQKYPKKWTIISNNMHQRNQNQCLHRYRRLSSSQNHKKIWSQQEDQMVIALVEKHGKNWKAIEQAIKSKNGKQIRERFINKLDPKIKKQEWSSQQDMLLISLFITLGSRWSEIAKKIPGRPQNRIKNRFYSYIQRVYKINTGDQKGNLDQISSTNINSFQMINQYPSKTAEQEADKCVVETETLENKKIEIDLVENENNFSIFQKIQTPTSSEQSFLDFLNGLDSAPWYC